MPHKICPYCLEKLGGGAAKHSGLRNAKGPGLHQGLRVIAVISPSTARERPVNGH